MEVYFASTPTVGTGNAYHKIGSTLKAFKKGIYKTTDKEDIIEIMSSEIYRRGEVKLVSDHELVNDYLGGEDPEYFTLDLLNKVSDEGLKVLAREYQTKNQIMPNIIKAELNKLPISDTAQTIINAHEAKPKELTDEDKRAYVDGLVESGRIQKAGPWYTDGEFKDRSYLVMYDHIISKRDEK